MKQSNIDVLIIGAGPAGLMAACSLARTGTSFRIIDKRSDKIFAGQADGLQCRTLETFQSLGFADRAWKEANHMIEMCFWAPDGKGNLNRQTRIADTIPGISRFQQVVLHQGRIEQWFFDSIAKWTGGKAKVERPLLPISIKVDESKVDDNEAFPVSVLVKTLEDDSATPEQYGSKVANGLYRQFEGDQDKFYQKGNSAIENDPSYEMINAKYVIGCDGAHSWVRKQLGIEMVGETTDFVWGVLDMVPLTNFPDIRNRCAIHSENSGSIMVIPRERDLVRLYIQLKEIDRDPLTKTASEFAGGNGAANETTKTKGRVDRSKITPEVILKNAKDIFSPFEFDMTDLDWYTGYQIGQRVADQFLHLNRVFIAGDACHTHSPKAGQGMNVSMMDTFNLAWKLAYVVKGLAVPELLSTYELERKKNARDLINFDHHLSRLFSGKPAIPGQEVENGVNMEEFQNAFRKGNEFASGTIIDYPKSIIEDKPALESLEKAHAGEEDKTFHVEQAKNILIGRRFKDTKVVNQSDAKPVWLNDVIPADGRWRIIVFSGDIKSNDNLLQALKDMDKYLGLEVSFTKRFTPSNARYDSVIEVVTVHASDRCSTELEDFPESFRPKDSCGRFDYWKIFSGVGDTFHEGAVDAYDFYGIEPLVGAIVVVRPDGYVSKVTDLSVNGLKDIDGFLSKVLIPQTKADKKSEILGDKADRYTRPRLAI